MWQDKKRAQKQTRRIPEKTLHFLELLGGWPGSHLAQHLLRHKNQKKPYQRIYALIVLSYQILSLEYLLNGAITKKLLNFF